MAKQPFLSNQIRFESAEKVVTALAQNFDLASPEWYLNRELTWLEFNRRVLFEAEDERTPLLERIKFLAIVNANLDEFFMKRIGGLKQQIGAGIRERTVDGRTPEQQVSECYALVRELETKMQPLTTALFARTAQHGICLKSYNELSAAQQKIIREHYISNIFPLVTPLAMDPAPSVSVCFQFIAEFTGRCALSPMTTIAL